ncbi:MAG TPA: cytochrome c biogenesis protein CcdA [Candidatus Coprovivens excrementavium]|nr:cytochrome c biogenesis protein CcdA [Candidatus Coprovivens excrementavium]
MEYLVTFIEGIASFISPCILPVIPIYISYFATESKSTKKSITNSLGFISGFSIIFILLGVFAGTFGKFIHQYSDYMNIIFGIFLIVIGLNYLGLIFIKFLNRSKGISKLDNNLTFITSILFGIIFSLSWTPCVGAFLSSALILASTTGSILKGAFLLLLYSLGLAIPFLITTIFLEKLKTTFDFIKKHYNIINKISGSILLLFGLWNIIKGLMGLF